MNVFAHFEERIRAGLVALQSDGSLPSPLDFARITAEPPRDASHGDIATNAALVLAKSARMKPRDIAELLAAWLRDQDGVDAVEIAGPGFLNMTLSKAYWQQTLAAILADGPEFGRSTVGNGEEVNVEYVSANPTGPMHVGHCRGAVFGDALANLLAFAGYEVTREYYINDAGAQVDVLARSAYLRYREALGEDIGEIPDGLYPGDYLKPVGKSLADSHGRALLDLEEADWLATVRETAISMMMDQIREDLAALNIRHDVFFSERSLTSGNRDEVKQIIDDLRARDLIYEGRLPPPKGEPDEGWEDREQPLFRATQFGDDVDRALYKPDGTYTYFASDMAYHHNKWDRGFKHMINVWGADHAGYIKRVSAAVAALTQNQAHLDVKVCQLVRLFRAGEPVKMSKRAGTFVTLFDVVDEVGPDPVRFMMLYRKNDAALDFDFAKVTEKSRDNPVFYVQYAHARAHSLFRNAAEAFSDFDSSLKVLQKAPLELLDDDGELALIKRLAAFPRLIESAVAAHEPHRLAFYLYELASDLHAQWNRGKDLPQLRFIRSDDRCLTTARVALVAASALVIASGLSVLGVQAPEEMR